MSVNTTSTVSTSPLLTRSASDFRVRFAGLWGISCAPLSPGISPPPCFIQQGRRGLPVSQLGLSTRHERRLLFGRSPHEAAARVEEEVRGGGGEDGGDGVHRVAVLLHGEAG